MHVTYTGANGFGLGTMDQGWETWAMGLGLRQVLLHVKSGLLARPCMFASYSRTLDDVIYMETNSYGGSRPS